MDVLHGILEQDMNFGEKAEIRIDPSSFLEVCLFNILVLLNKPPLYKILKQESG